MFLAAAERPHGPVTQGNDVVDITAQPFVDQAEVIKLLGADPGFPLVVVQVKFAPKMDNKIQLWHDDFTLVSARDGQRSQPLEPGQLAGKGSISVSQQRRSLGGTMGNPRGPIWGGIPGTTGSPQRMPGQGTGGVGNATSSTEEASAKVNNESGEKNNPMLDIYKAKILPETDTNDATTGLLYFLLDGKPPRVKDLTLIYKSSAGRVLVEFDVKNK
jgi:hypothetical protein